VSSGDIIRLLSGTYQGTNNLILPPSGKSGITLIAHDESNAANVPLLDGQFASPCINLNSNNSSWVIEGLNCKQGSYSVIRVAGGSNNNTLRRMVGWDALFEDIAGGHTNGEIFGVHDCTGNLLEDFAAFGMGRKLVNATQGGNNNTFRRGWIRFEGSADTPTSALSLAYNNYGCTWENILATIDQDYMPQQYFSTQFGTTRTNYQVGTFHGLFSVDILNGDICANTELLGSLAYVPSGGRVSATIEPRLTWIRRVGCMSLKHVAAVVQPGHTSINSIRSFALEDTEGLGVGTNLLADHLTSVHGSLPDIFTEPPWDVDNSSVSSGTSLGVSPWTAGAVGANLCFRYENGSVTTTPLWPWPMNERIKQATGMAGVYANGLNTFNGITTCNGCSGGRATRTQVDVQAEIEALLGTIPSQCLGTGTPILSVSPTSLSYTLFQGTGTSAQTVTVSNTGSSQPMPWSVTDNQTWLSESPTSASDVGTFDVTVNVTGLALGTYAGTITVTAASASSSPQLIPVTLIVDSAEDIPTPTISPGHKGILKIKRRFFGRLA
jgi:hypothetical protein